MSDMGWYTHLPVLPVLLPMITAVVLMTVGDRHLAAQRVLALASAGMGALLAAVLLADAAQGTVRVYTVGNWLPPFGIALVVDRLSALMLCLTAALAWPVLWFACRGNDSKGRHFHAMFQFQWMGLNGAFVTGDFFNLFVFFEILLIASYVLMLHGHAAKQLRVGVQYVVLNLAASAIFLIGLGLLYGLTGTLNMADVALRVAELAAQSPQTATLLRITALLLFVVFAMKAAIVPLHLWLPQTYASSTAPVAALFAIMTKVGIYAIVRSQLMAFGPDSGVFAVQDWLLPLGMAISVLGVLGALAAHRLARLVAWLTVVSVGTMLMGIGQLTPAGLAAALYYMLHSTLVMAAMFLLVELVAAQRGRMHDRLQPAARVQQPVVLGLLVLLGTASAAGLPPLPGFIGKIMLLQSALGHAGQAWVWAVVIGTGFLTLIGLARAGSVLFWHTDDATHAPPPAPAADSHLPPTTADGAHDAHGADAHLPEPATMQPAATTSTAPHAATPAAGQGAPASMAALAPVLALLCGVVLVAVYAAPIQRYVTATAQQVLDVRAYAAQVLPATQGRQSLSTAPYTGNPLQQPRDTAHTPNTPSGKQP